MSIFILDTNILSFYIRQKESVVKNALNHIAKGHMIMISPIAYYECKRGYLSIQATTRLKDLNEICRQFTVGQFNNTILETAAEIYSELKAKKITIEDADIFTAAFCRHNGFTLVTNNTKHFEHIANLKYCDWS